MKACAYIDLITSALNFNHGIVYEAVVRVIDETSYKIDYSNGEYGDAFRVS